MLVAVFVYGSIVTTIVSLALYSSSRWTRRDEPGAVDEGGLDARSGLVPRLAL